MRQITDERGLAALVALADTKPEDHALDVACGPGFLTLAFAARCAEAVGFDATPAFVERAAAEAARRGAANARFESGDAERLRSEERRVGKGGRSRRSAEQSKKKQTRKYRVT